MKNLHFGAGNIGRGFIGYLLAKNGFEVTFLDVNDALIQELKSKNTYTVEEVGETPTLHEVSYKGAINSMTEKDAVVEEIAKTDLITTSLGVSILPRIAGLILEGLVERFKENENYLNIVACENAVNATDALKDEILALADEDTKAKIEKYVGFPNSAVDRIVPEQVNEDMTYVKVEPFFEWAVETKGIKGTLEVEGAHFVDELAPYIERKLFTVNTGHAACAYFSYQRGYKYIYEAMKDADVEAFVRAVLGETSTYLVERYGFDKDVQQAYLDTTVDRFKNPSIIDEVRRVGRSPLRKLGNKDRFVRPLLALNEYKLPTDNIIKAMGLGLKFDDETDAEAMAIRDMFIEKNKEVIGEVTGLKDDLLLSVVNEYMK